MSELKIEIKVEVLAKDYYSILFRFYIRRILLIAAVYLVIIVPTIWLTAFGAGANPFESGSNDSLVVMTLFGFLPIVMAAFIVFNIWNIARKFEKTMKWAKFTITEEGLKSETELSEVRRKWSGLYSVSETARDFILFPQKNLFYVVPKRFFQSEKQIDEFKQLVRRTLGNKAKLKN